MAKVNNSLVFQNAEISLEDNTITEVLKEGEVTHTLSDVIAQFKDKQINITFKEAKEVIFNDEEL